MRKNNVRPEDFQYQIQKGIPVWPKVKKAYNTDSALLKYPYIFMEVGDSFAVPVNGENHAVLSNRVYTGLRKWATNYPALRDMNFISRLSEDGMELRVWRVEDGPRKPSRLAGERS